MREILLSRSQVHQGSLLVINRDHPLLPGDPVSLTAADDRRPEVLLERRAARLLTLCIRADGGWDAIVPVSGWRSQEEQQAIWDTSLAVHGAAFTRQ